MKIILEKKLLREIETILKTSFELASNPVFNPQGGNNNETRSTADLIDNFIKCAVSTGAEDRSLIIPFPNQIYWRINTLSTCLSSSLSAAGSQPAGTTF